MKRVKYDTYAPCLNRMNCNECNFAQIPHGIAKCRQWYLLLIPRMKHTILDLADIFSENSFYF